MAKVVTSVPMNKVDDRRIQELCSLIVAERDRKKFQKLVKELNQVLSSKTERLRNGNPGSQASGQRSL